MQKIRYKEDLVVRIRDLIDGYDSSSLLKEYLQNADDSGATELIVTFDKRIHSVLNNTRFEKAQTPSLLITNNSIFKEKDFNSIVKISAQGKVLDAMSTGRFGQGFSSSFSVSDHPSFISNGRAYWFDVRKKAVSKNLEDEILSWNLDEAEIIPWLSLFQEADLKGVLNSHKTIFRLPLRSHQSIKDDEENKISDEVFSFDNFLEWCEEWKEKSENLLFLRNIQKLVLQEIDEMGNVKIHLALETINFEEIAKINKAIQNEFDVGSLVDICHQWLQNDYDLPVFSYMHKFKVTYFDIKHNLLNTKSEVWAVSNGLFRGTENVLIHQALKALNISPNPRKVLPWAGAAISLDENNQPQLNREYQYFTFLPLPINHKMPIHFHGWFDLNPKRTEITDGGAGYDKQTLTDWNHLLLEHAVGVAWAILIDFIKSDVELKNYYKLWSKDVTNRLEKFLFQGLFKELSQRKCFFVKYKEKANWDFPSKNLYYLKEDNENLFNAFKEHFSIIYPKPTENILKGFNKHQIQIQEITPKLIRDYLHEYKKDLDYPVEILTLNSSMLSKKDWLIEILIFCSDNKKDFSLLDGLPLQLTLDNELNIIGDFNILINRNINLDLIQNKLELVLDQNFSNLIESKSLPSTWLEPNLESVIALWSEYIEDFDISINWIQIAIEFIYEHRDDIDKNMDVLKTLPLVLQENGQLKNFGIDLYNRSALVLPKKYENHKKIFIEKLGINFVHQSLSGLYKKLVQDSLIAELNSSTVAKLMTLHYPSIDFQNDEIRETLIEIIAYDISWIDEFNEKQMSRFKQVPFIKTVSDKLYSLSEIKLYISTSFTPPQHIKGLTGNFELISDLIPEHLEFYKKLGIQEQTAYVYLENIIIPFLENHPDISQCIEILKWLSTEWKKISENSNEEEISQLKNIFNKSKFVPDQLSGYKRKPSEVYSPLFELPYCLQDKKYLTITFEDYEINFHWDVFLNCLNVRKQIDSDHILHKVNEISTKANQDAVQDSVCLLNYIIEKIDYFDQLKYYSHSLLDELKKYSWIAIQNSSNNLLQPQKKSDSLLAQPQKVIRTSDSKIVGGKFFVIDSRINFKNKEKDTDLEPREIAKKIGLMVDLSIEDVYESFEQLRTIEVLSEQEEREIINYAKEFYKYLGRQQKLKSEEIPYRIKNKSIRIHQDWISSEFVFKRKLKINGVFSWSGLISDSDEEHDKQLVAGLELLGVREEPDINLYVKLLEELPINEDLIENDLKQAQLLLREIQKTFNNEYRELPLLTDKDILISSEDMYINDLPAYNNAESKNTDFYFCHEDFEKIARLLKVDSLQEVHEATLNNELTVFKENSNMSVLTKQLTKKYFKEALLRLLYSEQKICDEDLNEEALNDVLPKQTVIVDKLVIDYSVYSKHLFSEFDVTTFEDKVDLILYVLDQEDNEDMFESIAEFICDKKDLSRETFAIINRILRASLDEQSIKELLDKKHIKTLPKKIEMSDEESIYVEDDSYKYEDIDKNKSINQPDIDNQSRSDKFQYASSIEIDESTNTQRENTDIANKDYDNEEINSSITELDSDETVDTTNKNGLNRTHDSSNMHTKIPQNSNSERDDGKVYDEVSPPISPFSSRKNQSASVESNQSFSENNAKYETNGNNNTKTARQENDRLQSSNDRKPVYVGKETEFDQEKESSERQRAKEIGNKGEVYILNHSNFLLSEDNQFEKAPTNNKGFDILEKDKNGNVIRYIEVKTLTGEWGTGGVGITIDQLKFALSTQDKWWLFVVKGINTEHIEVFQFKNPVIDATSFMFDNSWRQLAYSPNMTNKVEAKKQIEIPTVGEIYSVNINGETILYEITKVKSTDKLLYVWAISDNETIAKKVHFNTNWEKV